MLANAGEKVPVAVFVAPFPCMFPGEPTKLIEAAAVPSGWEAWRPTAVNEPLLAAARSVSERPMAALLEPTVAIARSARPGLPLAASSGDPPA